MDDNQQRNSLLVVDDEEQNRLILNYILSPDYTVITAQSGADALEKARDYQPDLILLDIVMPDMDGYEVLAQLKNSDATKNIPVIIISGLTSSEDEEKGLTLDAVDYITKPFSTKIVKLRVQNQLQIINQFRAVERLSMIDQLTNIPNRRSFDTRFSMEWRHAIRENTPISILMMDVDKFKVYNDTYGHQQGDVVLKTVAKIFIQSLKRPTDFAARWGGEEFAVLLPNTPLSGALGVAETIRAAVEAVDIPCPDGSITKVTLSIGVTTGIPLPNSSIELFVENADKALYSAKETGRNKVVHQITEN